MIAAIIVVAGGWAMYGFRHQPKTTAAQTPFSQQIQPDNFVSSVPAHGATFPLAPMNVVMNVRDFLTPASTMSITKDKTEYAAGGVAIDAGAKTLRRAMNSAAPDGVYTVSYQACGRDGTCQDGRFQFMIDGSRRAGYADHRQETTLTIKLARQRFSPRLVRISPGTLVTWLNDDTVKHYVESDPNPENTFYQTQNSLELKPSDRYQTEFSELGAYPYHGDAASPHMTGMILVESPTI